MKDDKQHKDIPSHLTHKNEKKSGSGAHSIAHGAITDNRPWAASQNQLIEIIQRKKNAVQLPDDLRTLQANGHSAGARLHSSETIQRKIYHMSKEVKDTGELCGILQGIVNSSIDPPIDPLIIEPLSQSIYDKYKDKESIRVEKIIEIISIIKGNNGPINDVQVIMNALINPQSQENFMRRIQHDTRLLPDQQSAYIDARRSSDSPQASSAIKNDFRALRQTGTEGRIEFADERLRQGQYYKKNYTGSPDFREIQITPEDVGADAYLPIIEEIKKRVLNMGRSLVGAWYYNQANEKEIFDSPALFSFGVRMRNESVPFGKSMLADIGENATENYFYSFIEHKDSPFNTGTRFTKAASDEGNVGSAGVNDNSGRRLRVSLNKLVKMGAMVMGGDLKNDREEREKLRLTQNSTPHKLIASGGSTNDPLSGLLENCVNLLGNRLILFTRKNNNEQHVVDLLNGLLGKEDHELWDYLTRNILKPQLMTPGGISFGVKGMAIDDREGNYYTY